MMSLVIASLLSAADGSSSTANLAAVAAQPRAGGYRDIRADDPGAQAAARAAAESVGGQLSKVHGAQAQVVAGTNYQVTFSTTDGRYLYAVVFRALNGAFTVTSVEDGAEIGAAEAG
jgi:hypothetical protein